MKTFEEILGEASEAVILEPFEAYSCNIFTRKYFGAGKYRSKYFKEEMNSQRPEGALRINIPRLLLASVLMIILLSVSVFAAVNEIISYRNVTYSDGESFVSMSYAEGSAITDSAFSHSDLFECDLLNRPTVLSELSDEDSHFYRIELETDDFGRITYIRCPQSSLTINVFSTSSIYAENLTLKGNISSRCISASGSSRMEIVYEKDGYVNFISAEKISRPEIIALAEYTAEE